MRIDASPVEKIFRRTMPARVPNYEVREQQIKMALLVEKALRQETNLLAEAGTGTGKSFAYLVPLALYLAENGGRGVVSTATIALQEQLIRKDIPFLEGVLGRDFRAQLAKGKGNYLCLLRLVEETQSRTLFEGEDLARIENWAEKTETGDRSELPFEPGEIWSRLCADDSCTGRKCYFYRECFYFKAKARLQQAKIIVCNHALFFTDLNLRNNSGGHASLIPEYRVVIFDEAQHVEKTAQKTLSTEVSNMRLPALLYQLRRREGCNHEAVQRALALNDEFFAAVAAAGGASGSDKYLLPDNPEIRRLGKELQKAVDAAVLLFDADCIGEREDALFNCLERYNGDLQEILAAGDPEKVFWVEKGRTSRRLMVTLHATPLDVSKSLGRLLFQNEDLASVIMTSATLSVCGDFSYLRASLGCAAAEELVVASPFNYEEQCLLYIPDGLPDPRAANFYERVTPFIEEILLKTEGRAFVLFTSYRGMNEVYDRLAGRLPWKVLKQGDLPRQKLLEIFKQDTHSVLFATASFWEGVDVQGEALSCVILVKLPFDVPDDPVTQAKIRAIKLSGGNAFLSYSLPEAVIRLKQGFGRADPDAAGPGNRGHS